MAAVTEENVQELSGVHRAAIVLNALGPEAAAGIFKALNESEQEELSFALARVRQLPAESRQTALGEFMAQMRGEREADGEAALWNMLEKSVGKDKAAQITSRIRNTRSDGKYFEFLNQMDPQQIVAALRQERPQVLALVFCHLEPKRAAEILSTFDPELQVQVLVRIGRMDRVQPELVQKVEAVLRKKLSGVHSGLRPAGGPKAIAQVLNHVDRGTEKRIFETMQNKDAELLEDVKKLMLVFDDLIHLPDSAMQAVLRETDTQDLGLALKGAHPGLKEVVSRNLSSRAADRLTEEMELMGPKPRSEVEQAQQRVVAVVRRLEEEGKIKLTREGNNDDLVQ